MARQMSRKRSEPVTDTDIDYDEGDDFEDEDDETEAPPPNTRRRRGSDDDRGERRRPRKRPGNDASSDDDEDGPATSARRPSRGGDSNVRRPSRGGWDAVKKNKQKRFVSNEWKVTKDDETYLIKFLEEGPIEAWLEHFVDEKMAAKERASYTCGECIDVECGLCGLGIKQADRAAFNIAVIDPETGDATRAYWKATSSVIDLIEKHAHSRRNKPINRGGLYFEVRRTRKGGKGAYEYFIDPLDVNEGEWDDEYPDIDPLSDTAIDKLNDHLFTTEDVIKFDSRKTLDEVADWLQDMDED